MDTQPSPPSPTIHTHLEQFVGLPQYLPLNTQDLTLGFESRFESGNLQRAYKIAPLEYELFVSADYKTSKNAQWFFFKVWNTRKDTPYKISMVNFFKNDSIFNSGMRMLIFSKKRNRFFRGGSKILYCSNFLKKKNNTYYSTLSIEIQFPENDDEVYVSMSFPYTVSKLDSLLKYFKHHPTKSQFVTEIPICQSISGNPFRALRICNSQGSVSLSQRRAVVFCARVHPGESTSSFVMQEALEYLLSDSLSLSLLREQVVIYIIPMLNPDGVALGNARCNLGLVDLNRNYSNPSPTQHPTIFNFKKFLKQVKEDHREILVFVDIHSHSKKPNCFLYGNPSKDLCGKDKELNVFLHCFLAHCDMLRIQDCNFAFQKEKENCARVVLHREYGVRHSFTLENSFIGATQGRFAGLHFNKSLFSCIGVGLVRALQACLAKEQNMRFETV